MQQFVYTTSCRRNILLKYFDKNHDMSIKCFNCDNCCKNNFYYRDFAKEGALFLGLLKKYNKTFGATTLIKMLKGSKTPKINEHKNLIPEFFAKGSENSEAWWKYFVNVLIMHSYIEVNNIENLKFGSVMALTENGNNWLAKRGPLSFKIDEEFKILDKKYEREYVGI